MLKCDNRREMNVLTTYGWLSYKRYALRPDNLESKEILQREFGINSVYPLDEYLGLDGLPFRITCNMALHIAKTCILADSYEDVAKSLIDQYGQKPFGRHYKGLSDDTVRRVTNYVADIVLKAEKQFVEDMNLNYDPSKIQVGRRRGRPRSQPLIVYLQTDGAVYLAREEGNIQKGYREIVLGVIFNSNTMEEKIDDKGHIRPTIGQREYVCNVEGEEEHRKHLVATALKYGLEQADAMVMISDGADWIRLMKRDYFPFAQQILDLYHLKENVYKFRDQEFGTSSKQGQEWGKMVCDLLEEGKWQDVLNLPELKKYEDKNEENCQDGNSKGKFNLYRYIWKFRDCIDYPTYLEKGYLIGSGAVESGHRTVLQDRLKQAGMMWLPSKASGILALRAKWRSGLWKCEVVPQVQSHYKKNAILNNKS